MARPNEPDMPLKRTSKVGLGIHRTQIRSSEHDIVAISGRDLMSRDIWTVDTVSDWLISNLGTVKR